MSNQLPTNPPAGQADRIFSQMYFVYLKKK